MKLTEQFTIDEQRAVLWKALQQTELIASCMPGVEAVQVADPDNFRVRVSQSIGPMSATFDAKVRVLERLDGESIRFEALGKSVRGAVGSVRATNSVTLEPLDGDARTLVTLEGDLALAGALGSVGQKIVAKQASRTTAQFADNLKRLLAGEALAAPVAQQSAPPMTTRSAGTATASPGPGVPQQRAADRWAVGAVAMSAVSAVLSVAVLIRLRRVTR